MKTLFPSIQKTNIYFSATYLENKTLSCHSHQPKHLLNTHIMIFWGDHLVQGSNLFTMALFDAGKTAKPQFTKPITNTVFRYMHPYVMGLATPQSLYQALHHHY